ncbi:spermine synthase [Leptolyngbya sp. 'hensonii']|uniref:spermine/spermidine synthase domain-containing protein n=1 Tax=Leptolyngbya sp. 'hensonii' TaxID=1922337 RepID=UPI00094FFE73|nr:spermine synthase [Leptolyngbya sp. 'hensonii']OLP17682.1 spermine synthase [Leptolyngbya sp. 'hensonii']
MPTSLFVEHHDQGLAFYLNGDLQFDTTDEALYHEYLVVPAMALAVQRFPKTDLRVLICGGGDGLAARDVLRFPQVHQIDLVDYSPEVIHLGETTFQPFNQNSLANDRLTVHVQDAFDFVAACPTAAYHVILCDFTYPTCAEETRVYSQEWFAHLQRILQPAGLINTNGVSPENRTLGFWCLYQTLFAASLFPRPMQLAIPSFRQHGYGNWGFFLASSTSIHQSEMAAISLPAGLQTLTPEQLRQSFVFTATIAELRHQVLIHTLDAPQLFYYLLNPGTTSDPSSTLALSVDFLDLEETGTAQMGHNLLDLETTARLWLEQIYALEGEATDRPDLSHLLPIQHRYHSPRMTQEWLTYLRQLLAEIDPAKLLASLLDRSSELPPKVVQNLRQLAEHLRSGTVDRWATVNPELVMLLSLSLLMANLVTPDAVFAKGYSSSSYYNDGYSGSGGSDMKGLGFALTAAGGFWLFSLLQDNDGRN